MKPKLIKSFFLKYWFFPLCTLIGSPLTWFWKIGLESKAIYIRSLLSASQKRMKRNKFYGWDRWLPAHILAPSLAGNVISTSHNNRQHDLKILQRKDFVCTALFTLFEKQAYNAAHLSQNIFLAISMELWRKKPHCC